MFSFIFSMIAVEWNGHHKHTLTSANYHSLAVFIQLDINETEKKTLKKKIVLN